MHAERHRPCRAGTFHLRASADGARHHRHAARLSRARRLRRKPRQRRLAAAAGDRPLCRGARRRPECRNSGHPHARGASARSRLCAARQDRARPRGCPDRRSRADGAHPDSRRGRPRHHCRAGADRRRARHRQAGQGRLLPDRPRTHAAQSRHRHACSCAGVTTEVCVHTTVREANDRGYRCLVLADACGSYFPEFHEWHSR